MKSPFNEGEFITRRNSRNEQALSTKVIYNELSTRSVVQQIPQETKHRDIISRSTSNNSSQVQEFNLLNALVTVRVKNELAESKWSYL